MQDADLRRAILRTGIIKQKNFLGNKWFGKRTDAPTENIGNGEHIVQHRQPKIERVCETCADWKTCSHTESWRIRQACSHECDCYWKPAQLRASA